MFLRVCLIEFEDSRRSLFGAFLFFPFFLFSPPASRAPPFCAPLSRSPAAFFFFFFFPLLIVALSFYALLRFNTYTLGNIQDSISHGGGKKKQHLSGEGREKKKKDSRSESLQADNNNKEDKTKWS